MRQSIVTAERMMMPEKTNCRFVSTPRIVREYVSAVNTSTPTTMPWILPIPPLKEMPPTTQAAMASVSQP